MLNTKMGRTKGLCSLMSLLWLVPTITVLAKSVDYSNILNQHDSNIQAENIHNSLRTQVEEDVTKDHNWYNNIKSNTNLANNIKGQHRQKRADVGAESLIGFTIEYEADKKRVTHDSDGTVSILEGLIINLRLFGHFTRQTVFGYSKDRCTKVVEVKKDTNDFSSNDKDEVTVVTLKDFEVPSVKDFPDVVFCLKPSNTAGNWTAAEDKPWLHIHTMSGLLPMWIHILLIIFLLLLSGLFSGLNLGLMSLNKTDLKIIINTGNPAECEYAKKIAPVRNHGNFLLCCLLFSNVLVNATLTILVDELTSGVVAVIMSTLSIVIFGEIIPQAICSRHGLAVGAKTIYITKFFMAITFPLAYPLSKLLDRILGEEIGNVYTRERLKELLKVTRDYHGLENEEVGIISGTLDMKSKTVKDIMTPLDDTFMLPIDANLDYETIGDIEFHGFSRIPVYDRERSNVVSVLNVKQLTLLDASQNIPVRTVVDYYNNSLFYVFDNTRLDYMFKAFREGSRGHMAFVQRINNDGPGDNYYDTIGVVTMEDVLEELLQQEIMDESDIGKTARGTTARKERPRFTANKKHKMTVDLPPPLIFVATQYLTTNVEAFKRDLISESVLRRLVTMYARETKPPKTKLHQASTIFYLYEMGRPADYFILMLEGRVEILVGKEKLNFEAGPFHHFGADFLMENISKETPDDLLKLPTIDDAMMKKRTFMPDYTVKVISDVTYIRIKYSIYRSARVATEIERSFKDPTKEPDDWQDRMEKMLTVEDEGETEIRKIEQNHINHVDVSSIEPPIGNSITPVVNRKAENDKGTKAEVTKLL